MMKMMKIPNKNNVQKLREFIENSALDDKLDDSYAETRRNWAQGKEAGRGFKQYKHIDRSKELGSPENPRNLIEHWQDDTASSKYLEGIGLGGLPRRFAIQREGGISGPVTDATARYGKRSSYDTSTFPAWHEVSPTTQRERTRMGLDNSLQKEGDGGGDGGAFNGLDGTVFTSSHAGIFTPTFGERGTAKRHRKNRHKQDKKRKRLMGKDKKSGVERLVQYLYDGSPQMSKAERKRGKPKGPDYTATPSEESNIRRMHSNLGQEAIGGKGISDYDTCPWCTGFPYVDRKTGKIISYGLGPQNTRLHNLEVHQQRRPIGGWSGQEQITREEFDALSQPTPKAREEAEQKLKAILTKARKMGLAPGLDEDMTGDGATAHAGKNNPTGPMRVNHKKTGRVIEDALKVAENNEPHINMGLAGGMEASIAAAYPQEEDPSVMNGSNPRKAEWNDNKAYVQKAEDDRIEEVADKFKQGDVHKWLSQAPLSDSLHAYIEGTPAEDAHFEYLWRNADIDGWVNHVRDNDDYQDALQQNLSAMSKNTGKNITVYRGHHKDTDKHGAVHTRHTPVSLSPTTAMSFRHASRSTAPGGTPIADWQISSWNVPIETIVAHGHPGESEMIIPKKDLQNQQGTPQSMSDFTDTYLQKSAYVQKAEFHEETKPFWHPENDMWNGAKPGPIWHSPPKDSPSDAQYGMAVGFRAGNHKHGLLQNQFDRYAEQTGTPSPTVPRWEPEETWSNLSLLELGQAHHPDPNFAKWQQDDWAKAEEHRPLDSNRDLKDAFKREYPDMIEDALQKSDNEGTTMTSPTENKPWSLEEPQDKYIERTKDNPNEAPAKDAVVKENDMQRRIKSYDNKEEDTGHEQPAGSMAAAGMNRYPSGATMQMSSFGFNTYEQDALTRGGMKDMEDPEVIEDDDSPLLWVPEAEKVAKLEAMRKQLEAEGDETPLMSALMKLDYE